MSVGGRSKAEFAALRELVGLSQSMVADVLHLNSKSVKSWESPAFKARPSEAAWKEIDALVESMNKFVEGVLREASQNGPVELCIVRIKHRDISSEIVNARVRAAVYVLISEDVAFTVRYVDTVEEWEKLDTYSR